MGASKADRFTAAQNDIATIAKALGHPARIAIIEHLAAVNSCICGDLVDVLPLAQPTVSRHLKELKSAGLIKGSIEGNTICYCIAPAAIEVLENYFGRMLSSLKEHESLCCHLSTTD